jgi:PAS domain S-box-containing protein
MVAAGRERTAMEIDHGRVLDALPAMVWAALPEGRIDFANRRWSEYTGLSFDEARGWDWQAVVNPDDLLKLLERWQSILASGEPGDIKARVRRFDGQYRWHLFHCNPLRDDTGRITRWCGVATDVDDFRRAEEALRESERQSRLIVDTIPGLVAVFGPRGEVEGLNKQFLEYLGQTQEEFANWATNGTVHPDDLVRHIDTLKRSLNSGLPIDFETRLRRFDNVYRWVQIRGDAARDGSGKIVRWYCLMIDVDERKHAEEALAASERNLQLTIDTIPALAWSARLNGTADFLSRHYLDYLGLSAEQVPGWSWASAVHPDDLSGLASTWQAILSSGKPGEAEARLRRSDGEYRWFLFRANPLRDDRGNIVKWYGVNTDIEDRKRSDEGFRAIVETTPECVKVVARDGTVVRTNAAGAVMAGVPSVDDVVGQSFFEFVAPEHRAQYREFHEKVCAGQKGFLEFDIISLQGVRRHMETHAAPLPNSDGSTVQLGVTRDITERKQTEERLRRSEAFLAEGQYLARMGNLSWNVTSGEIIWSEPLYRIFEFEPGTVVTLDRIASRVHPEDMSLMVDMVERAQRGESDFEYQHRIVLPDRSIKHLHLIAHRARDHADQVEYIGAVLDVTQRQISEEALEKLRSELAQVTRIMSLGALTASIAHEVNQPLAGIITNAGTCLRMLAADPPNIDGARETARRTIRDGNRAADVIARLRALFSKKAVAIEPVNLNEAVREVIALSWGDLQRRCVVLRTELADGLPLVGGDRIQLQQVIMNLLRNAADAMSNVEDRPRRLLIQTIPDQGDHVRLSVQDTGVGFGPQGAEKLFDAFYTTKSDGMGIGLSVSRSIIESHSGRLWAEANDGPGATFSFSIPEYSRDDLPVQESGAIRAPVTSRAQNAAGIS